MALTMYFKRYLTPFIALFKTPIFEIQANILLRFGFDCTIQELSGSFVRFTGHKQIVLSIFSQPEVREGFLCVK